MKKIITFGTFDVLHVGHLSLLERARGLGDALVVGISTDQLNLKKKARAPVFPEQERIRLVASLRCVDQVFFEESLAYKREYIKRYNASILVMGDEWEGKFDDLRDTCDVVYLSRTPSISTTATIERIRG